MTTCMKRVVLGVVLIAMQLVAHADVLLGHVVGVSDGDTISVLDASKQQHKIRLMGIDAPEKAQAFGQKSKQSLSDLVFNKRVEVTWFKRDRFGRIVGQVIVDGTMRVLSKSRVGWRGITSSISVNSLKKTDHATQMLSKTLETLDEVYGLI